MRLKFGSRRERYSYQWAVQILLGQQLRAEYQKFVSEPLPAGLVKRLKDLDGAPAEGAQAWLEQSDGAILQAGRVGAAGPKLPR